MGKLVIISGGPGSGKTSLIEALRFKGYRTFDEVPRCLITRYLEEDQTLLPWNNLDSFAKLCLKEMKKQKKEASECHLSFTDRAIGDIVAYLNIGNIQVDPLYINEAKSGYDKRVFLLKPQKDFYVQDEVRPHTFTEALDIHDEISRTYEQLGFLVHQLPPGKSEDHLNMIYAILRL